MPVEGLTFEGVDLRCVHNAPLQRKTSFGGLGKLFEIGLVGCTEIPLRGDVKPDGGDHRGRKVVFQKGRAVFLVFPVHIFID